MVAYGTIRNVDSIGGTSILTGTGVPPDATGTAGDYWLDGAAHILYGPKQATYLDVYATNPLILPERASNGPNDYTLGLTVKFVVAGVVTGLRFYRSATSTVTSRTLTLYRAGVSVATATSSGETGSGWKTVPLAVPLAADVGVDYVTTYQTKNSYYSDTVGAVPASVSPSQITIVGSCYGNANTFPNNAGNSNYYADLAFTPSAGGTRWPVAIRSAA